MNVYVLYVHVHVRSPAVLARFSTTVQHQSDLETTCTMYNDRSGRTPRPGVNACTHRMWVYVGGEPVMADDGVVETRLQLRMLRHGQRRGKGAMPCPYKQQTEKRLLLQVDRVSGATWMPGPTSLVWGSNSTRSLKTGFATPEGYRQDVKA